MTTANQPVITDAAFDQVVAGSSDGQQAAINFALGGASMCWSNPAGAGEFQSDRASQIGKDLKRYLGTLTARADPNIPHLQVLYLPDDRYILVLDNLDTRYHDRITEEVRETLGRDDFREQIGASAVISLPFPVEVL